MMHEPNPSHSSARDMRTFKDPDQLAQLAATPVYQDATALAYHPDAELLRLSALLAEIAGAVHRGDGIEDLFAEAGELARSIAALPASTAVGVQAKLQALAWCWTGNEPAIDEWGDTADARLGVSLTRDLLFGNQLMQPTNEAGRLDHARE